MSTITWDLVLAIVGSGCLGGAIMWIYSTIKNKGISEFKTNELFCRVDDIEKRQDEHDTSYIEFKQEVSEELNSLEKKMNDSNKDLALRLTKMEVDLSHIKEMQIAHNQALIETSRDIKQILSRTPTKE
jgi:phenylalanyl-tRNA synthetase alpha subunit